jgi:aryl carrier-like protein
VWTASQVDDTTRDKEPVVSQQNAPTVLSEQQVVADVAGALGVLPSELSEVDDLFDAGLDSIRLMALIEKWRAAGSVGADFPTLAAEPMLNAWIKVVLGDQSPVGGSAE